MTAGTGPHLQHAALHENPVEELIRRLAAAASYAALSPFRSKMGLANQELIEEMFYGRRQLLEHLGRLALQVIHAQAQA